MQLEDGRRGGLCGFRRLHSVNATQLAQQIAELGLIDRGRSRGERDHAAQRGRSVAMSERQIVCGVCLVVTRELG